MQLLPPSPSQPAPLAACPKQLLSPEGDHARKIDDALMAAEDHMVVSLWDEAAAALDALPAHAKTLPGVALVYLDLLIGQQLWDRGLMHALGLLETRPSDSELWLRIARLMAGAGYAQSSKAATERCLELNPECACFLATIGLLPENYKPSPKNSATRKRDAIMKAHTHQDPRMVA
jgi:hypothetical protein